MNLIFYKNYFNLIFNFSHINIGSFYLLFSFWMFFFAGIIILGVRLELFYPGLTILSPNIFNSFSTIHGLIMIFGVIIPSFTGLGYWLIPFLSNSSDMFFSKLGSISLILLIISSILLVFSNFFPSGSVSTGWTLYAPLSIQMGYNIDLIIFCIYFLCLSSIMNAINISITILKYNKIKLIKFSIFLWSWLVTSYLIIISMPVLIGLVTMLFLDRHLNTSFFNPVFKGDVIMYQHIFWFFGHPEVYIMILPAFGIISQIISVFSKKKIFGYNSMIYAIVSISILSLVVWGHHMFNTGIPIVGQIFFMYCTMLISIPTGIKIFNWIITIWRGFIIFDTPMLFCIGFLVFFVIGGFSGFLLSIAPLDIYYHGTYFVVAHFHYILVCSSIFSIFASFYYWSPLIFKVKYNEFKAKFHFWFSLISLNITFFPMHFLGLKGMSRRYIDYFQVYCFYNKVITIGSIFLGLSQLYFLYFIFFPLIFKVYVFI